MTKRARNQGLTPRGGAGARGRKPESPVARVLRGAATFRELVKMLAIQVPGTKDFPPPPDYLGREAEREYERVTGILKEYDVDLINVLEYPALETYCVAYEMMLFWVKRWKRTQSVADAQHAQKAILQMTKMAELLGLNPHSRYNMIDLRTLRVQKRISNPTGDTNHGRREFEKKSEQEKADLRAFVKDYNQAAKNFDGKGPRGNNRAGGPSAKEQQSAQDSGWSGF